MAQSHFDLAYLHRRVGDIFHSYFHRLFRYAPVTKQPVLPLT